MARRQGGSTRARRARWLSVPELRRLRYLQGRIAKQRARYEHRRKLYVDPYGVPVKNVPAPPPIIPAHPYHRLQRVLRIALYRATSLFAFVGIGILLGEGLRALLTDQGPNVPLLLIGLSAAGAVRVGFISDRG